ncbi:MAG: hypothetical protein H7Y43_17910 [Akkermansiaceae bacterium]|nr:hypothetical protein [Verrucomicrobiales bacterium]
MNTPTPSDDFLSDLLEAGRVAGEQETEAKKLLVETVDARVKEDPAFRRSMAANPERALQEEARKVGAEVSPELIAKAKEKYSTAIYGATEADVKTLVFETLENLKTSFTRTVILSQVLFFTGLVMTLASFLVALLAKEKELIAGIFGGGGILTLITYAVMNPLDRIRNAAANLVQVQIAYLSYYKQLTMLGGGDRERMTLDETVRYSKELREGAVETIKAVQGIVDVTKPYDPRPPLNKADEGKGGS